MVYIGLYSCKLCACIMLVIAYHNNFAIDLHEPFTIRLLSCSSVFLKMTCYELHSFGSVSSLG